MGKKIITNRCNKENCFGPKTGLLTKYEILELGIINSDELDNSSLKGTSYDLKLGDRHYLYQREEKKWIPIFIGDDVEFAEANKSTPNFIRKDCLKIEPYGTALIQHRETVDLFSCVEKNTLVSGRFDLKLKIVAKGLFSQQATQVEPYSKSKLFCYLFNLTPNTIELYFDQKISTIEFYYVSCLTFCDKEKREEIVACFNDEHKSGKYQKLKKNEYFLKDFCYEHGISDIRYFSRTDSGGLNLPDHGGLAHLYLDLIELKKGLDKNDIIKETIQAANQSFEGRYSSIKTHFFWTNAILTIILASIIGSLGFGYLMPKIIDLKNEYTQVKKQVDEQLELLKKNNTQP